MEIRLKFNPLIVQQLPVPPHLFVTFNPIKTMGGWKKRAFPNDPALICGWKLNDVSLSLR